MSKKFKAQPAKPGIFDKFIDGFVSAFGSKYHFALATFGAAFVIYMIFHQGYNEWLLSTGLASNNYESAIEYFLAVGTLYQTARITITQALQQKHMEEVLETIQHETDEIDALLKQNTDLTQQVKTLIDENTKLTKSVHDLLEVKANQKSPK